MTHKLSIQLTSSHIWLILFDLIRGVVVFTGGIRMGGRSRPRTRSGQTAVATWQGGERRLEHIVAQNRKEGKEV